MKWIHDQLCKWLGIWDLEYRQDRESASLLRSVTKLERKQEAINDAVGKLLARANPIQEDVPPTITEYSTREAYEAALTRWETRWAESNKIAEDAIKRIFAEEEARRASAPVPMSDEDRERYEDLKRRGLY